MIEYERVMDSQLEVNCSNFIDVFKAFATENKNVLKGSTIVDDSNSQDYYFKDHDECVIVALLD
jgi:hypothetical protein